MTMYECMWLSCNSTTLVLAASYMCVGKYECLAFLASGSNPTSEFGSFECGFVVSTCVVDLRHVMLSIYVKV